jgi:hypothetical protein
MANLKRVRCTWTGGGVVGPSVSTFYFKSTASGFSASLQTFFQAIKASLPDDVTIQVPNTGDTIDETNGQLVTSWTDSGGATTVGTSTAVFAIGSGFRIRWITGGLRDGRKVVGTTFVVPASSISFDTTGRLTTTNQTTVLAAANALITAQAASFVVWGKPHSKALADGQSVVISAADVPLGATQLRSRRV